MDCTAVKSFLNVIGRQNTSIDFPTITDYRPGTARFHGDSIRTLELIRENCMSLAYSRHHSMIIPLGAYMRTPVMIADAALELIDARFKEISSSKGSLSTYTPMTSTKI